MPSKSSSRSSRSSSTTTSNSTPRYNLSINPPYQINYRAKRAGKHISATKRRISFQFGFSSLSAIRAGKTEVNCRGEEHEIVLIWSHITGKRELFMDGKSIHLSKVARGNTKFEYSFNLKGGNHVLKIIAHGTPPMGENSYKQFDLELDGMSYFRFAKIYELGNNIGRKSNSGRSGSRALTVATHSATPLPQSYDYRGMAYDVRDDAEYEEEDTAPMSTVTTVDLFDTTQTTAQPQAIISPVTQYSEAASQSFNNNSNSYNNQPSLTASSYSSSEYDEFTPVNVATQPKSFDSVSNEILSAYAVNNNGTSVPPPPPCDVSNQSSSRALVPVSEEGMDAITKSMKSLVNLDDITAQPFQPLSAINTKQQPKANNWGSHVGRAPTLSEMREPTVSPTMSTRQHVEVMKAPPAPPLYNQGQPQQMVGYGYQQQPQQQIMQQQYYGAPNNMGYGAPAY